MMGGRKLEKPALKLDAQLRRGKKAKRSVQLPVGGSQTSTRSRNSKASIFGSGLSMRKFVSFR